MAPSATKEPERLYNNDTPVSGGGGGVAGVHTDTSIG